MSTTSTDLPKGGRLASRYVVLTLLAVLVAAPLYVTVIGAFKPGNTWLDYPRSLLPWNLTTETIRDAWSSVPMGRYLLNTLFVATAITTMQLITSIMAAYAFAFLWFPLKRLVFVLFLATLAVPSEVTIVVNVETMQHLGWIDSYQALVVPFMATAFGTFLLRQVFLQLPTDLVDASRLDGLGHIAFLREVCVPLARPTIAALAVFSFLSSWNQYLWPLLVTNTNDKRTIQIGLKVLSNANLDKLNAVLAGAVIAGLPIFIVLLVFQRQLIRGLTAGAVKG